MDHAIDHIKNGSNELAINLLQTEMANDMLTRRKCDIIKIKARTVFASMFYAAFLYLILMGLDVPPELNTIVSGLFGFYWGSRNNNKKEASDARKTD